MEVSSHYSVDITIKMFLFFDIIPLALALGFAIGRRLSTLSVVNLVFVLLLVGGNFATGYLPHSVIYNHLSTVMWVNTGGWFASFLAPAYVIWKFERERKRVEHSAYNHLA
jgi:hypothetical protein